MCRFIPFLILCGFLVPRSHAQMGGEPASGPWGTLIGVPIILEPDDASVSKSQHLHRWPEGVRWRFKASSPDEVADTMAAAGISGETIRLLVSDEYLGRHLPTGTYEIRPPEDIYLSLPPKQRASLYAKLAQINSSIPPSGIFNLAPGGIESVLRIPHGLPQQQIERIKQLTYPVGRTLWFADINYLLGKSRDEAERYRVIKTLRRQPALSLQLVVKPGYITSVSDYWSAEGRNKEILPILESVVNTPGVDKLDVVHLLPPFPRKVIFSYPSSRGEWIGQSTPDCFWTATSFFSESPPDRHLDGVLQTVLDERYTRIEPTDRKFGDLILFIDKESGNPLHACNWIAGNFVFTKNGNSLNRPWIFSTLDSVIASYLEKDMTLLFFRLKPGYRK